MVLSREQIARYSRQLILPEIGVKGQERLLKASVLIVGAGGLGSPVALYLAAAGVGTLGIVDHETVELSNLHRQILHGTSDLGRPKSESAQRRVHELNPDVHVNAIQEEFTAANARALLQGYALVVDGSDNFTTRYLVNDACVLLGIPFIYGGVVHVGGQVMVVRPRESACFRCVFPEPPSQDAIPNCQQAGVLGATAGVIGSLMAHEAIKLLVGLGEPLVNRLVVFDGAVSRFREVVVQRNRACAVCGDHPVIRELASEDVTMCANA